MAKRLKVYYPDGQIQKGLYTEGREFMFEDGTEYIGDYHTYSTGEVFTKSAYIKSVSEKLIPFVDLSNFDNSQKFEYDKLNELKPNFAFATYGKTIPTQEDYNQGFVVRYFAKRHFNDIISEVTKETFGFLRPEYYVKLELRWKLVGDAPIVNERVIRNAEKDIKGISNYITNYSEFVKV